MTNIPFDKLIPITEAARRLPGNIKPRTLRTWIAEGRLPGYRIGGEKTLVNVDDLASVIEPLPVEQGAAIE